MVKKVKQYQNKFKSKIVDIMVRNCTTDNYNIISAFSDINVLRRSDYENHIDYDTEEYFLVRVSVQAENQIYSILSLVKTTFICMLLVGISLAISKDAQELVMNPIESIMEKVNRMAVDPFQVIFFNDLDKK